MFHYFVYVQINDSMLQYFPSMESLLNRAFSEFCGILPEFLLYWASLAVASWIGLIIW
jgi:hypothetical protein